jgi:hypothetical protein
MFFRGDLQLNPRHHFFGTDSVLLAWLQSIHHLSMNCVGLFDDFFFKALNTTWTKSDVADSDSESKCSGIYNTKIKGKESKREKRQTHNNL